MPLTNPTSAVVSANPPGAWSDHERLHEFQAQGLRKPVEQHERKCAPDISFLKECDESSAEVPKNCMGSHPCLGFVALRAWQEETVVEGHCEEKNADRIANVAVHAVDMSPVFSSKYPASITRPPCPMTLAIR